MEDSSDEYGRIESLEMWLELNDSKLKNWFNVNQMQISIRNFFDSLTTTPVCINREHKIFIRET